MLDKVGGLGRYQWGHLLLCAGFWFANVGTPISLFANSPWCLREGDPALCLAGDETVPKSPETWWSPCRSPSRDAQTEDLRSPTSTGLGRGVAAPFARRRPNRRCALNRGGLLVVLLGVPHRARHRSAIWQPHAPRSAIRQPHASAAPFGSRTPPQRHWAA